MFADEDVYKANLVKSCLNNSEMIRVCARIGSADVSFQDFCCMYDVHCQIYIKERMPQNFRIC